MKLHAGFSLIELMVYCSIAGASLVLLFQWGHVMYQTVAMFNTQRETYLALYHACSCFMRDVHETSDAVWVITDANTCMWHHGDIWISYGEENGKFIRSRGVYDCAKNQWASRKKTVIAASLDDLAFDYYRDDNALVGIALSMLAGGGKQTMKRIISCHKGKHLGTS